MRFRLQTSDFRPRVAVFLMSVVCGLMSVSCGYTTRPGLPSNIHTVYVKPFANKIDFTVVDTSNDRFPLYRHGMEVDITNAVISRFQFTGLLRPANPEHADVRLEGELIQFRRDPLRYTSGQDVEEWRLNVVVDLRMYDQHTNELMWEEPGFTGDTTYFALGASTESEAAALSRAITDLARRIVERAVENW